MTDDLRKRINNSLEYLRIYSNDYRHTQMSRMDADRARSVILDLTHALVSAEQANADIKQALLTISNFINKEETE